LESPHAHPKKKRIRSLMRVLLWMVLVLCFSGVLQAGASIVAARSFGFLTLSWRGGGGVLLALVMLSSCFVAI
jgi:hypothetical protein